ncbi:hypothetical protein EG68_12556 [Paragonimus skrjabini miyazakii]|uniref:Uncharacterized protein n=1 Tax=Paragonimus skrjabini miyazakii TaxID=59628 RepID=A0A8S9YNB4_9TREM|nr:hypothetical protein EG68_12556 [Paragonimus skrjabini miyazakii]
MKFTALDSYFAFSVEQWSHSTPSEAYGLFYIGDVLPDFSAFSEENFPLHCQFEIDYTSSGWCSLRAAFKVIQKTIASELWSFLNQCSPEALSPALDLIACLSCDLRDDFYNYIDQFLPDIFRIILENYQNADILQSSFNCLAHIVYFLHKPMLLDVENTIKLFTPLLMNKTKHIPHFAAECLAFVLRKVSDRLMLLFHVWRAFEERLDLMGILLREVMCGSNGKLHSIAYELLPLTLDIVCEFDTNSFHTRASNIAQAGVRKGLHNILKRCPVSDTSVHVQYAEEKNKFLTKLPAILKVALSSLCAEFIDTDEIRYIIKLVTKRFEFMKEKFKKDCFENMVSILACLLDSIKRDKFANLEDCYGQVSWTIFLVEVYISRIYLDRFIFLNDVLSVWLF